MCISENGPNSVISPIKSLFISSLFHSEYKPKCTHWPHRALASWHPNLSILNAFSCLFPVHFPAAILAFLFVCKYIKPLIDLFLYLVFSSFKYSIKPCKSLLIPDLFNRALTHWFRGKEPSANARDTGLIPGLGRFPWRRKWQPTLVLTGKSHGQRSLASYSPWCGRATQDWVHTCSHAPTRGTVLEQAHTSMTFSVRLSWNPMKVKVKSLSHVQLFATLWTVAHHAPLSMGFSRQEYWSGLPFPSPGESSRPRDQTQVSHIASRRFNLWVTRETLWPCLKLQPSLLPPSQDSFSLLLFTFFTLPSPNMLLTLFCSFFVNLLPQLKFMLR